MQHEARIQNPTAPDDLASINYEPQHSDERQFSSTHHELITPTAPTPSEQDHLSDQQLYVIVGQPLSFDQLPLVGGPNEVFQGQLAPRQKWRDGICDCLSQCAPSCLMSFFCPCVMLGQIQEKMGLGKCMVIVLAYIAGYLLGLPMGLLLFVVVFYVRGVMRSRFHIEGDGLSDCCASFWCTPCVLAQMARQLYNYNPANSVCLFTSTGEMESV